MRCCVTVSYNNFHPLFYFPHAYKAKKATLKCLRSFGVPSRVFICFIATERYSGSPSPSSRFAFTCAENQIKRRFSAAESAQAIGPYNYAVTPAKTGWSVSVETAGKNSNDRNAEYNLCIVWCRHYVKFRYVQQNKRILSVPGLLLILFPFGAADRRSVKR